MQPEGSTKAECAVCIAAQLQVAPHTPPTMVWGPHSTSSTACVVPFNVRTQRGADAVDTPRLAGSLALVMHGAEQGPQSLAASQNTPRHGSGSHSITEGGGTRPWSTHWLWSATDAMPPGATSTHCTVRDW
jgi:hypothetical protein